MASGNDDNVAVTLGSGQNQEGPVVDVEAVMTLVQGMVQQLQAQQHNKEVQDRQIALLREDLIAAQAAMTSAIEKAAVTKDQKSGATSIFYRLQPRTFAGTEGTLEAERWMTDTTDLLKTARVPEAEKVEVVSIQLTDVARTWWLAEEVRLEKPISWEAFADRFYAKFLPETAEQEIQRQFLNLRQLGKSVEAYAAEFLRLSRFAPQMIPEEADKAYRFQQGLRREIQEMMVSQKLHTYDEVLAAARQVENFLGTRNQGRVQNKAGKRPMMQGNETALGAKKQKIGAPANQQNQIHPKQRYCGFCKKAGHLRRDCRLEQGLCLICGSGGHQLTGCDRFKSREAAPAMPEPLLLRAAGPVGRGAPLPSQQQAFQAAQRRAGAGRGGGQAYQMNAEPSIGQDFVAEGNKPIRKHNCCLDIL